MGKACAVLDAVVRVMSDVAASAGRGQDGSIRGRGRGRGSATGRSGCNGRRRSDFRHRIV
jgi:large exoprotein involved in heme utilization and adhesion